MNDFINKLIDDIHNINPELALKRQTEYNRNFVNKVLNEQCNIAVVSGSAFTKEDLKKAYNNGSRQGSVNGMRVARGDELNVKTFDEWYDEHYR